MNKRENLLRYLESDRTGDYVPAAFFLHFGADFRHGQAAVQRHQEFFEFTGMDFAKIQFELDWPNFESDSPLDFARIPPLPMEFFAPQLEVVKGLVDALKSEALVVLTLYSPFMVAGNMVGQNKVISYLEEDPSHVFKGLETITDSLLAFIHECRKLGLDGFYHSTQGGESKRFSNLEIFTKWVKPTDHRVMNEIEEMFDFNILHICDYHAEYGKYATLDPFSDYPGSVVNVSTEIGGKTVSPAELERTFGRPYMGGMNRLGPLATGSEFDARAAARAALMDAPPRFILGADCTVPGETSWDNLRGAIDEAHHHGG